MWQNEFSRYGFRPKKMNWLDLFVNSRLVTEVNLFPPPLSPNLLPSRSESEEAGVVTVLCDLAVMFIFSWDRWKDAISDLKQISHALRGSSPKQQWCNFTELGWELEFAAFHTHTCICRQWPNFYKEQISFPLLISHNAFLRCANKLPEIHIHKPRAQTNDELSTLSQQEGQMKWKWNIQPTLYHAITIGVLSCMNNRVCVCVFMRGVMCV